MATLDRVPPQSLESERALLGALLLKPDAIRRIAREVIDIAHAVGCKCDIDVETMISDSKNLTIKPSIVRDLDNGRPMELDAIFTVPMEFGKMFGVQTPMLELFVTLMKLRAKAAKNQRT